MLNYNTNLRNDNKIPEEITVPFVSRVAEMFASLGYVGRVAPQSAEKIATEFFSGERVEEQIRELAKYIDLDGKRLLEIGSGFGYLVATGRFVHGWDCWGVEPANELFDSALQISRELLGKLKAPPHVVVNAVGEALPFHDSSFDVVYSTNVLEHVQEPERVILESLRVLKPEGILQFIVPNYGSWWEGHYGILWIPNMPRWLARLYVRLYSRDPSYLDTLQLVLNRRYLERVLKRYKGKIEILSWGVDVWEDRLRSLRFSEWASLGKLKRIVRLFHRLRLVGLVIRIGKWLHWETPMILTVRKLKQSSIGEQLSSSVGAEYVNENKTHQ